MLCFFPQNEASRASGGIFLLVRGLIWVGSAADWNESSDIAAPYNSILGQMDKSFERTLSLILAPLMWYRILGCQRGFHTQTHWHSHTQTYTHRQSDFMLSSRMWLKTTERCKGRCLFSVTCQLVSDVRGHLVRFSHPSAFFHSCSPWTRSLFSSSVTQYFSQFWHGGRLLLSLQNMTMCECLITVT